MMDENDQQHADRSAPSVGKSPSSLVGSTRSALQPNSIREIRKRLGLTLDQLGKAVGLNFTTIAKVENSQRRASERMLKAIAEALNVTVDDLLRIPAGHANPAMRNARVAKGLKQADVAKAIGLDTASISRMERGLQRPSTIHAEQIAEMLGIDAWTMMNLATPRAGEEKFSRSPSWMDEFTSPSVVAEYADVGNSVAQGLAKEIIEMRSLALMLHDLQHPADTIRTIDAMCLPIWVEDDRIGRMMGRTTADAVRVVKTALSSHDDSAFQRIASNDPIASIVIGILKTGRHSGKSTIDMLRRAMVLHPVQRNAYGILVLLQSAANPETDR